MNTLQSLSKKLTYVAENKGSKDSLAMQDVIPEFERLRAKAVVKVPYFSLVLFILREGELRRLPRREEFNNGTNICKVIFFCLKELDLNSFLLPFFPAFPVTNLIFF